MDTENRRKRKKSLPITPKREGDPAEEIQPEVPAKTRRRGRLRRRWLMNTLAVTLVVVAFAVSAFSIAMYSYYTSTILATLESKAQTAAGMFRNYTETNYLATARQFVNQFEEKTVIEVQILNADGRVQISSMVGISGASVNSPDTTAAISLKRVRTFEGIDPDTGDSVISASAPVIYNGTVVGVVRMVTSLREVQDQMIRIVAVTSAIGLSILIVMGIIASYFIRSVLDPVIRVTETAKRIAAGSYGVQMEKQSDDEMGELVDSINDMSMKIDQAERTQSEFISSVSHELRTPLTAINGWAETLYSGEVRGAADVKKGMGIIVSEAQRLTRMVEELLEFSRMETGRFNLSVEPIDILAELEDAVYTYREFFRRKGLELDYTECEEELPIINGDPERLRQVFCNLLDNADKHGGSGGRVEVSVNREEDEVVIRIRDHGPGVPEDELPFIKYKFYKGSSKARGSGIGLAVCEEIINSHNGSLDIGNAPGGGCVVTIRLPIGVESV
ncbi:MAG: HAMP domain-containing histidine kinase [Clostridiales bacterium]|nr:HAMP domain-containing histidine kinase [Clostridiales bacterium]